MSSPNPNSPIESVNGATSKFKTLKKKIKNKFRLSSAGDKTIAQAVETLKRSNDLLAETAESDNSEALKTEFKGKVQLLWYVQLFTQYLLCLSSYSFT